MRDISYDVFALRKKTAIKILLKSLIWAFALFGAFFILLLFVLVGMVSSSPMVAEVPDKAVLTVDFDNGFGEVREDSLLADVSGGGSLAFSDMLAALEAAAFDERVKAVAGRIHVSDLGPAQMQELYQMIMTLRHQGKQTYIFAPGFGSFGGGTAEYFLATAFDEITMLPNTEVGLTGVSAEVPFARELLDELGITPEFYARYEYKGGMSSFTDEKASQPFKENMVKMLGSLNFTMFSTINKTRFGNQKSDDIFKLIDKAPFSAEYALEKKLIDRIEYEGDWLARIKKKHEAETIDLADYASGVYRLKGKKSIAVMVLDGTISDDVSVTALNENEITPAQVLQQVDELNEDKNLAGVLVRINSPGGSYNAANEIWHALVKLKENKKIPLYVSMGNYAASGGYFVALAGDRIFATDVTITGSVGVFGGKFVLEDLWKKLKINWELFDVAANSGILSPNFKFSPSQKKAFEASLDRVYKDFASKVAEARKFDAETLDKVARGRIWTGADAFENGLVDELGGFENALSALRHAAGIEKDEPVTLLMYPKPKTFQEKLSETLNMPQMKKAQVTGKKLGIDSEVINMLKRLQYNAILPPIIFKM